MGTIYLIGCGKRKRQYQCPAKDLYISDFFKNKFSYAVRQKPDHIFILSTKYGLVKPDQIISPYDLTLKTLSKKERDAWGLNIINSLKNEGIDINTNYFVLMGGEFYRDSLIPLLPHYTIFMDKARLGPQMRFFKNNLRKSFLN